MTDTPTFSKAITATQDLQAVLGLEDFGSVLRLNAVALGVDFTPGFSRGVRIFLIDKEDQTVRRLAT